MRLIDAKGVFVVDSKDSPLWRAASSHANNRNVDVLSADEFFSPLALSKAIHDLGPRYVIFSWRGALDAVLASTAAKRNLLECRLYVFLLIPDFIGLHAISELEQRRIQMADCLLVTSKQLCERYSETYLIRQILVLHDYPPLNQITEIQKRELKRIPNRVIWVGNSKWGERAGFEDHKGLNGFARPVVEILSKLEPELEFVVIDSARGKMPYAEVLREIATSSCLIMTSDSEGTALPILESAHLGTPVVSLDVGIASELFAGELSKQISPRDVRSFALKIQETLKSSTTLSKKISECASHYESKVLLDFEKIEFDETSLGSWRTDSISLDLPNRVKWKYRWIRYLFTKLLTK